MKPGVRVSLYRHFSYLAILISFLSPTYALAHPVSFEGGTMMIANYSKDWREFDVNYTYSPASAIGISELSITDEESTREYLLSRLNTRFRRNGLDYQSNLYLSGGLGVRSGSNDSLAGTAGVMADYEMRRVYTLGLAEGVFDGDGEARTHFQYRFGFAPYITHFNGLSTWLIGQVDFKPYLDEESTSFTPTIRLFYNNLLFEAGINLNGDLSLTWMYSL